MTTAAQVKRMLRPILERNNDLALIGRLLVIKPVRHFLRGVFIDQTSTADVFKPHWLTHHVFTPRHDFTLSWGGAIRIGVGRLWRISDPATAGELSRKIENEVLPLLRPMGSLRNYVDAATRHEFSHQFLDAPRKIVVDAAMGDVESARAQCPVFRKRVGDGSHLSPEVLRQEYEGVLELCELLERDDIAGVIAKLHAWEEANAKRWKLEKVWERTPFPIESMSSLRDAK